MKVVGWTLLIGGALVLAIYYGYLRLAVEPHLTQAEFALEHVWGLGGCIASVWFGYEIVTYRPA